MAANQDEVDNGTDLCNGGSQPNDFDKVAGAPLVSDLNDLDVLAHLCGWTLARAHARSGDATAIAAYLGSSPSFDRAIADFAERYADQNERDYEQFKQAASSDSR